MKKYLCYILSLAMVLTSTAITNAKSNNSLSLEPFNVEKSYTLTNGSQIQSLIIEPEEAINKDDNIILSVRNGSFDKTLLEQCKYSSSATNTDYDTLYNLLETNSAEDIINQYVVNEGSNSLPYSFEWIASNEISVKLFPVSTDYINSSSVKPAYEIKLPVTTYDSSYGDIQIIIDDNGTSVTSANYTVAYITDTSQFLEEPTYTKWHRIYPEAIVDAIAGDEILYKGEPNTLNITPVSEVSRGESILIHIKNGSFDKTLIEKCQFKTDITGLSFDELYSIEDNPYRVLRQYVGDENSRNLPYKIEYVDSDTIKVHIFPIYENYVNRNNVDITKGVPIYKVKLPAIAGSSKAATEVAVQGDYMEGNNVVSSSLGDYGWYSIANVDGYSQEYTKTSSIYPLRQLSINPNEEIIYNNEPNVLVIKPIKGIDSNTSVNINIENGSFSESMVSKCNFQSNITKTDYNQMIDLYNSGISSTDILTQYIGNENSRMLPYNIEYVNNNTIKVDLFPIVDNYVGVANDTLTMGVPIYAIKLPAIAGDNGYVKVAVNGSGTNIDSAGYYTIAYVNTEPDFNNDIIGTEILISSNPYVNINSPILSSGSVPVRLQVFPKGEVLKDESIYVNISNGSFSQDMLDMCRFKTEYTNTDYDTILNELNSGLSSSELLTKYIGNENSRKLPYSIEYIDNDTIKVNLFPIDDVYAVKNNDDVTKGSPMYDISLPAVSGTNVNEDVIISIDSNNTVVPYCNEVIAHIQDASKPINIVVSRKGEYGNSYISLPNIDIREELSGTITPGKIVIRADDNFVFDKNTPGRLSPSPYIEMEDVYSTFSEDGKEAIFEIAENNFKVISPSKRNTLYISGLCINANESYVGDINVTMSSNFFDETVVKVGEKVAYNLDVTTKRQIPTLYSGKIASRGNNINTVLDENNNTLALGNINSVSSALIRIRDSVPGSLNENKEIKLSVPKGVTILGCSVAESPYSNPTDILNDISISDDGSSLIISPLTPGTLDSSRTEEIGIVLYIKADMAYEGQVLMSTEHNGYNIEDIVIAQFVKPVANIGETGYVSKGGTATLGDIVFSEGVSGVLKSGEIVLSFNNSSIKFDNSSDINISTNNGREISNIIVENGSIRFTLGEAINSDTTVITISGATVSTVENVNTGLYDLSVSGSSLSGVQDGSTLNDVVRVRTSEDEVGDVNGDGKIDYSDAILVLRGSSGTYNLTADQKNYGDVNGDNVVDYRDAIMILRHSAGTLDKFN